MLLFCTRIFCATLEPPDRDNLPNVSSIPAGHYWCLRVVSPTFNKTFEVTGVPGRSKILFHAGNTVSDTAGCIILGQYVDKLRGDRAVLNSGATFRRFMDLFKNSMGFNLVIEDNY